jgi:hypothetical protein
MQANYRRNDLALYHAEIFYGNLVPGTWVIKGDSWRDSTKKDKYWTLFEKQRAKLIPSQCLSLVGLINQQT